ncbi:MAG: hypothetical protein IPN85_05070 [Flavobacteriales bacterium]|nr:hypothetical protein [Flavobacteriales bacterium]
MHFLSPEGDGMYAVIDRMEENAFMGFKHVGMLKDGKEVPPDDTTREWTGAREEYELKVRNNGTELLVIMDVGEKELASFKKMFPEALAIAKELAEA